MDTIITWSRLTLEQPGLTVSTPLLEFILKEKEYKFEHDSLLNGLPKKLKSGNVLVDQSDLATYTSIYILSCLGFLILYLVLQAAYKFICFNKYY